jgi:hypothetical protein
MRRLHDKDRETIQVPRMCLHSDRTVQCDMISQYTAILRTIAVYAKVSYLLNGNQCPANAARGGTRG